MRMPLQNRGTPLGEVVADPARGLVYANRGCLHDVTGRIVRRYNGKRWIACRLRFKGRRRPLMRPGRFTELFFLDEATAFAAGHRPCAECRRSDYDRFVSLWHLKFPDARGADAIDAQLHAERVDATKRAQRHHDEPWDELPDGTFAFVEDAPHLLWGDAVHRWSPSGYTQTRARPTGKARVITPASIVAVLRHGWVPLVPFIHPSATSRDH